MRRLNLPDWVQRFLEITIINIFISLFPASFVLLTPDVIAARSLFVVSIVTLLVMMGANVFLARRYFFSIDQDGKKYVRINVSAFLLYAVLSTSVYLYLYSIDGVNALIWVFFPAGIFSYFGLMRTLVLAIYLIPFLVAVLFAPAYNYRFISKRFNDR